MLMGQNLNWYKSYDQNAKTQKIKDGLFNSPKFETDKWLFYDHIWLLFGQLYNNLSQNWDSDSRFKVLNEFKT